MKKAAIILICMLILPVGVWAQSSMTDNQIMEYIISENAKGASRSQIVTHLMERGVTVDRIRKIRAAYEKQKKGDVVGARNISGLSQEQQTRLRKNNGKNRDDYDSDTQPEVFNRVKSEKSLSDNNVKLRRRQMSEDLNFVLPDSLAMFDELMDNNEKPKGRQVFGRNIFNNKNLTFESDMNIAMPSDYRLGPGDAVFVDVWGASQKSFQATVSPDGYIDLEGFGPVNVAGLTVAQANSRLRGTLGSRYQSSNVRLSVGQTKTITVNVMGEVKNPGTFTLSAFATVFNALYMAGGTNEIGTLRNIKIYRSGRLISTCDIYDYILNGRMTGNVRLASGDVIVVSPYEALVNITGKVRRPMFYEMKHNESVGTLIKYAGGFRGDAYTANVRLVRKAGGMYSVYSIDEFERNRFQLADEDSVSVDSVLDRYSNMVEVKGAVFRPGMYQMDGNITTVRQLLETAGGTREDAFVDHAILRRLKDDRTHEVVSVDVKGVMNHDVADISLRNGDVLYVPSKRDMQEKQVLTIMGEVVYPGEYEFSDNMTLEDFILQAGGLTDAASLVKIDVSRRIRDNKALSSENVIAKTYSFSLRDGFVISGENNFKLEPFDEVYVRRSPGYVEQQHVTISGEIAFGGKYTLSRKASRLSDLVKNAGGLTAYAYAKGARLERQLTPEEKIKLQTMLKIITVNSEDSTSISKVQLGDTRTVGINLDKALENPGSQWDVVLQDGDKLIIPQFNNTVSINGEVMYPNTVAYSNGAGLNHYINQAGGYGQRAKSRRVFAVNMNGTVTRVRSKEDISPGCEIIVPAKSRRKATSLAEIMGFSTLGVSLASVVAAILKR